MRWALQHVSSYAFGISLAACQLQATYLPHIGITWKPRTYYHFDYVGGPQNYKRIYKFNCRRPGEQMSLAYERGTQDIWIVKEGDLKGARVNDLSLEMAWDMGRKFTKPESTGKLLRHWIGMQFGDAVA